MKGEVIHEGAAFDPSSGGEKSPGEHSAASSEWEQSVRAPPALNVSGVTQGCPTAFPLLLGLYLRPETPRELCSSKPRCVLLVLPPS